MKLCCAALPSCTAGSSAVLEPRLAGMRVLREEMELYRAGGDLSAAPTQSSAGAGM